MAVTVQEVRHVAMLARIAVTEQRAVELAKDLNTILEHMDVLGRVSTQGVEEASGVGASGMPLRVDRGPAIPLGEPPEVFAPEMRDGFFVVPRLSTHGDAAADGKDAP
jgi:aspartyl-tRNA(Asn)/glutamyl-tRNA(Gln) amidotransferase subunit C